MGIQDGGIYTLQNVQGETYLDLDFQRDGQTVHGWENHGGDNQKWRAIDRGNGWIFESLQNGHFLSVAAHNLTDGLNVAAIDTDQTLWRLEQDDWVTSHGFDVYRVVIQDSGYSLDLADHGNPENGTPVTIWGSWEGKNQLWRFNQVG